MSTADTRTRFLRNEFFGLTQDATLQHNATYRESATEADRARFRADLYRLLDSLSFRYATGISDEEHIDNIVRLADELSVIHESILRDGRFRLGSAQKALNLYLKYLWCAGLIPEPPHCPFDSRIIAKLPYGI